MAWKQKSLTGLMAGGFALRWLAEHHGAADDAAFRAALHAVDIAFGWMLAVGAVLLLRRMALALRAAVRGPRRDGG